MGSLTTTGVVKGSLDFRQVIEIFFLLLIQITNLFKGGVEALIRPCGMFRFINMTVVWIFFVKRCTDFSTALMGMENVMVQYY